MFRLKRNRYAKPRKTEFIVKESYSGTKKSEDIFANIFISEYGKKPWTSEQKNDIIQNTDNFQISCCSRKE